MTLFSSTGTIDSNVWTHVAVVLDKEKNLVKFFRDNVLEGSVDASALNLVNNSNVISIGKNDDGDYFSGKLDDVRVYDRAITSDEITGLYNDKYTNNLILHYDFEQYDHAAGKVYDESKYGTHGNLINKEIESEDFTKDIGQYVVSGTAFKAEIDQYIEISTTSSNIVQGKNLENCTFAAWVKTNNLNSFEPIIHKPGVFSFGLNYGHATLQLGDGTQFHDLPAMTLPDTSTTQGEWVLIHRDVIDANPGTDSTIVNVGTDAAVDDITQSFSLLGSLKDGSLDSDFKIDGKYTFRMIPYGSTTTITDINDVRETYDDIPFGTRYFQWSQTANPTLTPSSTGDAGFQNDLTIVPAEFKQVYDDHATGSGVFEGLAVSESTSKMWLDGQRGLSGQYQYGVGYIDYTLHGYRHFMYNGTTEYRYKLPHKVELWMLKKPEPPITTLTAPSTEKLITDINFNTPIQLSSELPGQTLEFTSGYQDGGVAVKLNEVQHIELDGSSFSNNNMNTMTFSAWIKPDSVQGNQTILSRYGLENTMKLQMVDNELMLSINNTDNPVIDSLTGTKQYDLTTSSYKVNVTGKVRDSSGGKLYVFALRNDYSVSYLEDHLVAFAKANVTHIDFEKDNVAKEFSKELTTYKNSILPTATADPTIQFDSDFNVYFVAVDALGKSTVDKMSYADITNLTTIDNTFTVTDTSVTLTETVDMSFTVTTPVANAVEVYAVAYIHSTDFPQYYTKVLDLEAGLTSSAQTFSMSTVYSTTASPITNISAINTVYVYMYAVDPTTGQRVSGNVVVDPVNPPLPHITLPTNAYYDQFNDKAVIPSGATVFSSIASIQSAYPPVAFTSDVDLTDTDALKTFFTNNITQVSMTTPNKNQVGVVPTSTELTGAYTGTGALLAEGETNPVRVFPPTGITSAASWTAPTVTDNHPDNYTSSDYYITTISNGSYMDGEYKVFASSTISLDDQFLIPNLFDHDNTDSSKMWGSHSTVDALPSWVAISLPDKIVLTSYSVRSGENYSTQSPKNWTLEGSNDESTWDVIDTRTSEASWTSNGETRTYDVLASKSYKMYRLHVSAVFSTSTSVSISALLLNGTLNYAVTVPIVNTGKYQVIMAALDSAGNMGFKGLPVPGDPFDNSVYKTTNASLTQTSVPDDEPIFDRPVVTSYAWSGMSMVTLENGDNFYGPELWSPYNDDLNTGRFIDTLTTGSDEVRPTHHNTTTLGVGDETVSSFDFYYEPASSNTLVNQCTVYIDDTYATNPSYNEYIYEIGWVNTDNTFVPATNTSVSLPYVMQPSDYVTGFTITFDTISIGPKIPVKVKLAQNNQNLPINEVQFSYDGQPPSTFAPLSTLKTSITSTTLDATEGLTLTGDVTADENNATSYYAFATTKQIATNEEARTLITNNDYAGAVVNVGTSYVGPYQIWVYMLQSNTDNLDMNRVPAILVYDTPDAWPGASGNTDEYGNRLSYTVLTTKKRTDAGSNGLATWDTGMLPWDVLLTEGGITSAAFYSSDVSTSDPIMKLGNIDSSVKSIYISFFTPDDAFNFKFELRDNNGTVMSEFTDETQMQTGTGDESTIATVLAAAHGKWNVPSTYDASNLSIPKVLDINNNIVDSTAVNYANVYLYGTDGVELHDDIDKENVPAKTTQTNTGYALEMLTDGALGALSYGGLNVEISPNDYYSILLRLKTTSAGDYGTGTFFQVSTNETYSLCTLSDDGSSPWGTRIHYSYYLGDLDPNDISLAPDTWYTIVARIKSGVATVAFFNELDLTDLSSPTNARTFSGPVNATNIYVNNATNIREIDYFVVVPDDLSATQLASVYTDYEHDIQGFLDTNSLTPTIHYSFSRYFGNPF